MGVQDFRRLDVWCEAHQLTLEIYSVTGSLPDHERYGLRSQLRRCSASIPTNIAEACGRVSGRSKAHFLQIATGSAYELEYLLELARDVGYIQGDVYEKLTAKTIQIKRMLVALRKKVYTVVQQKP